MINNFFSNTRIVSTTVSFVACVMVLVGQTTNALAQSVSPMIYELSTYGSDSSVDLRIDNKKSIDTTFEIIPNKITYDEQGNETETLAEEDFLIYPPQTLVAAGRTQMIKVKYIGDPEIAVSQTYRVRVRELPVDLSGGDFTGIAIGTSFGTLCYVTPDNAKASVLVSEVSQNGDGKWSVKMENSGNRFLRLSENKIEVSSTADDSIKQVLQSEAVLKFFENNTVPPKSKVVFSTEALEGFDPESTVINISDL